VNVEWVNRQDAKGAKAPSTPRRQACQGAKHAKAEGRRGAGGRKLEDLPVKPKSSLAGFFVHVGCQRAIGLWRITSCHTNITIAFDLADNLFAI
jgi:hypothetical protein